MRTFDYHHRVGFEDTNLVGNVYYANYVRWQGRCREMFLYEHAPQIAEELRQGLSLVTTRVSCTYYQELMAFDEVIIRMRVGTLAPARLSMLFDYVRRSPDGGEQLVAQGEQEIACLRREGTRQVVVPVPEALTEALAPYLASAPPPPASAR